MNYLEILSNFYHEFPNAKLEVILKHAVGGDIDIEGGRKLDIIACHASSDKSTIYLLVG